ncbi:MAG: Y-family DNA polymerase [Candidatus Babeliales bacterium]|nr:Y-family DNA polymerase [Candidatus Babeliales bacterium]
MPTFALVDCNNFFVSCERVFNPKLANKPVVVLSSNDACVIARSNEAKALGIKMGEPVFKCDQVLKNRNVFIFSSNFTLYNDMSKRVMQSLTQMAREIEVYSIDEAFVFWPDITLNNHDYSKHIKHKIKQNIGLPVSIGLGPTKTLAKMANNIAKKSESGVFEITESNLDEILKVTPVGDIWGIGRRYTKFLISYDINTAYDLKNCDDNWVRKNLSIIGLKTVMELRGISCFNLDDNPEAKKSICVSRSFGKNVIEIEELKEALALHVTGAAAKLRKQNSITSSVNVFIMYTKYHDNFRFYQSLSYQLPVATAYTPDLIRAANICLEKMFKPGLLYKKVGIVFYDFVCADFVQMSTINNVNNLEKQTKVMRTIDKINSKKGKNKVFFAAALSDYSWESRRLKKSANFTTNWNEILTIKI